MSKDRERILARIEREEKYLSKQEVGTEEYKASLCRLNELETQLAGLKDSKAKNVIETAKVVAGVAMPLIGYVAIIAAEKELTFAGALRDVTKCFLPKKMF